MTSIPMIFFARTLNAAAIAALPEEVNGKIVSRRRKSWSLIYIYVLEMKRKGSLKPENRRWMLKRRDTHGC